MLPTKIDRDKVLNLISRWLKDEITKPHIGSGERLGMLMGGLNQGTISKLVLKKYSNIPDFATLEAIAFYFNYSYSGFLALLEKYCAEDEIDLHSSEQEERRFQMARSAIYNLSDLDKLAQLNLAVASQINMAINKQVVDSR